MYPEKYVGTLPSTPIYSIWLAPAEAIPVYVAEVVFRVHDQCVILVEMLPSFTLLEVSLAHKVGWCNKSSSNQLSRMLMAGLNNNKPAFYILYKSQCKMSPLNKSTEKQHLKTFLKFQSIICLFFSVFFTRVSRWSRRRPAPIWRSVEQEQSLRR